MRMVTLVQVEAAGIQEYIFGSNDLKQNIGASELVHTATTRWISDVLDTLEGAQGAHNARWDMNEGCLVYSAQSLLRKEIRAEVIYSGGGGALVLFEGPPDDLAVPFTWALTNKAARKARGLRLVVESLSFDLEDSGCILAHKHAELREKLTRNKLCQPASVPLSGISVNAQCVYTGLPVVGRAREDGRLISTEVQHKRAAYEDGNLRLTRTVPNALQHQPPLEFAYDFDQIGQRGEASYLAVAHIDGNGMGERFKSIAEWHDAREKNEAYLKQVRALSEAVQIQSTHALRETVQKLLDHMQDGKILGIPLYQDGEKLHLFFRPLVFGGDDITLVCDGRVGIALAAELMQALSGSTLPGAREGEDGGPFYTRAGVAIVHTHYPFSRAYYLAEALCRSAKRGLKSGSEQIVQDGKGCVIDWHIATTGMVLDLQSIRAREYCSDTGASLLARPLWVERSADPNPRANQYWHRWRVFSQIMDEFQNNKAWSEHRNKMRSLQDALRQGPAAVEEFLREYPDSKLPEIGQQPGMQCSGWSGEDCGYFDALELFDFFIPLEVGGQDA